MTTHSQRALILCRRRRFINNLLTYLLTYLLTVFEVSQWFVSIHVKTHKLTIKVIKINNSRANIMNSTVCPRWEYKPVRCSLLKNPPIAYDGC